MKVTLEARELLGLCTLRGIDWHVVAREAQKRNGLAGLTEGRVMELSSAARATQQHLRVWPDLRAAGLERVEAELEAADRVGAHLITVLDEGYPQNLRLIYNPPPFLFVRGTLLRRDAFSLAVVGTREATAAGLAAAGEIAARLAKDAVTVVSGLAKGIDTAAHEAALAASGRTIAVLGTGICKTYPKENRDLAERIADTGALVSQFFPSSPPTRASFPMRNVTMSGISQGTVVVEASATSGAKMQARLALEHGKRVFLLDQLVTTQAWARAYSERRGAEIVTSAQEISGMLRTQAAIADLANSRRQLVLDLATQ